MIERDTRVHTVRLSRICRPRRVGKFFENADMLTRRRHVGDMSGRHVADLGDVVALFDATPSAPCRHAHDMPTTCP